MLNREKVGIFSGLLASVTLADVSLVVGIMATLLTILCLVPTMILNWRKLRRDYLNLTRETRKKGIGYFLLYCFGGLRALKKETEVPFYNSLD